MATQESLSKRVAKRARVKAKELRRRKGWIASLLVGITKLVWRGIAKEAHGNWVRVHELLDLKIAALGDNANDVELEQVATAAAYLEVARDSATLAEIWTFLNEAEQTLCRAAKDAVERAQYLERLEQLEPVLNETLVRIYSEEVAKKLKAVRERERSTECERHAAHAAHWHLANQEIGFSLSLWRYGHRLLASLLLATVAIGVWFGYVDYWATGSPPRATWPTGRWALLIDLSAVTILGLFGASLSLVRTSSATRVTAITYRQERLRIGISLVLGACGGVVLYSVLQIDGILGQQLKDFLFQQSNRFPGLLLFGIVSGYSERLWREALDKIANMFPTKAESNP